MALIKNAKSNRLVKEAIVLDMGDRARQAQHILSAARSEASAIIEKARIESQRLIENGDGRGYGQGHERGLAEGKPKGEQQGREAAFGQYSDQLAQLIANWSAGLQKWEADRAAMYQDAREEIIRFAFALGRKVAHRIVKTDPTVVRDQVESALTILSRPTSVEIMIHPADRRLIEEALPSIIAAASAAHHVNVREDASVNHGGCIIATPGGGRIDATIDAQLDRIAEALVPITE